jgi:hypothetical protein
MKPALADTREFQQFLGHENLFFSLNITFQVMAVAEMSAGHQNTVAPAFECLNNKKRIHATRTHDPDGSHIRRVLKPGHPCQVSPGIGAPVTEKGNDFGFNLFHIFTFWIVIDNSPR